MIRLRPAEPQDEWAVWELRREIQPELTREQHLIWWNTIFEHRFMAYDGPVFVGVIRITPLGEPHMGRIHLQVIKKEQGNGWGTQMLVTLRRVAKELGFERLDGLICVDNVASQKAFLGAEYAPTRFEVVL